MSPLVILALVLALPPFVVWLFSTIRWFKNFVSRHFFHFDICLGVIGSQTRISKTEARIRLVYAGSTPLIWEATRVIANLRVPSRSERTLAWFQIALGYLLCNTEGLTTVFGNQWASFQFPQIHLWRGPKILTRLLSSLYGLSMLYVLLWMLLPFGWPFLFAGPYGRFQLIADGDSIKIKDVNGNDLNLPVLLKPSTELEFTIDYRFILRATGFSPDTKIEHVNEAPKRITLKLPTKGHFVLQGDEIFQLRIRRWRSYPVNLGLGLVRIG